jgi:DNA-binding LacI/PurR family transcriptional regulator
MATIKDVAARANVAPSIVSRLLNADPTVRVRPETRLRVEEAARALNYSPNRAARALRGARVGALGVALRHLTSPVYAQIFSGAEAEARRSDLLLVAVEVDALAADPAMFQRFVRGGAIDGLILQRDGLPADDVVMENLLTTQLPFVIVNERVAPPLSGVALDDVRASRLATGHLLALGHREIGHLAIGGSTHRSQDRQDGWEQALTQAGLNAPADLVAVGGSRPETGYAGMMDLLARRTRPTGVVVGTLLSAIGALAALRDAGLRVPDDIAVVGAGDIALGDMLRVPLTTISWSREDQGKAAADLLLDRIEANQAVPIEPRRVVIPPQLVVRRSSGGQ